SDLALGLTEVNRGQMTDSRGQMSCSLTSGMNLLLRTAVIRANRTRAPHNPSRTAEIGRAANINQLPFDITSDWRRLISRIGAITSPSTSGAGSNENLRST